MDLEELQKEANALKNIDMLSLEAAKLQEIMDKIDSIMEKGEQILQTLNNTIDEKNNS